MKKNYIYEKIKFLSVGLSLLVFFNFSASAQSWQWAKSGGATDAVQNFQNEEVKSISAGSDGSIYFTSRVGRTNLLIDGNAKATYSNNGYNDNVIASFKCDGSYKWSKIYGSYYGSEPISVGTDSQGNVYAAGKVIPSTPSNLPATHLDSDVVFPVTASNINTNKQSVFLIKYDSNGNYLWHRLPQPDNVSRSQSISHTASINLQVDSQGNSFWFCLLPPGVYGNGAFTATLKGFYVLKYDKDGNFLGGIDLHIQAAGSWHFSMTRDKNSGAYYVGGEVPQGIQTEGEVTINGEVQSKSLFVAAFSANGQFLWKRENTGQSYTGGNENNQYVTVDDQGNIYFSSKTEYYISGLSGPADSFNGVTYEPTTSASIALLVKLDANGNTIWQTNGSASWPTYTIINGNEVAISSAAPIVLNWQSLSYQQGTDSGAHPLIIRFNKANGNIIAINAVYSSSIDAGTALASDSKANYYLGGRYAGTVTAGPSTLFNNGGGSDFFLAKFGSSDCDFLATTAPETKEINAYPNPFKSSIKVSGISNADYLMYNVLGTCVSLGKITDGQEINTDNLAKGFYVLKLTTDQGEKVFKLVKE